MSEGHLMQSCPVCDGPMPDGTAYTDGCAACRDRYPAALLKAHGDYFDYALRLRTGEVIRFMEARIEGDWVHLTVSPACDQPEFFGRLPYPMDRGLDVRIDDIVWVADAPEGA